MRLSSVAAWLLFGAVWGATISTARAECNVGWFAEVTNGYCDGCQYKGTIDTGRNQDCERAFQQPGVRKNEDVVYLGARILQRAKHGIAGASGATVAYHPNKDFVGTDQFVLEMSYKQNGKPGKFTARYDVNVK